MNLPHIRITPFGAIVLCVVFVFCIYMYAGRGSSPAELNGKQKSDLISLKHLLAVSVNAAELGGIKVKEVRFSSELKEKSKGKTKEGANDPVTIGDMLSHKEMMNCLKKSFPNLKIVSEEHDNNDVNLLNVEPPPWSPVDNFGSDVSVPSDDVLVWIDPLDATQEYTENLLDFVTVLVCVSIKGRPVIGVIHRPFQNLTVWSWVGKGTSNPLLVPAAEEDSTKPLNIIVSRSHSGKVESIAKKAFGEETKIVHAGGAGYKALQVAEGKADAYVHVMLIKKWDICAGNALLDALGGQMTDLAGKRIDYSDALSTKSEKGLVATIHGHKKIVDKLSGVI